MTWSRRDLLASLGVASAGAIALACGSAPRRSRGADANPAPRRIATASWSPPSTRSGSVASAHALAVSRRRVACAQDRHGAGIARRRTDGVVLSVRDARGQAREQVTSDLSQAGVLAAARELAGGARAASLDLAAAGPEPAPPPLTLDLMTDLDLLNRVDAMARRDASLPSRIVYAAAALDIDDTHVWSASFTRAHAQRLVRVRRAATRIARHGARLAVSEVARAWTGDVDAQNLSDEELAAARDGALALFSPDEFATREYRVVLEPAVAAVLIDAVVRALMTSSALRRPEVAARQREPRALPTALTLVDDPTIPGAYGGARFDDRGEPSVVRPLVAGGQLVGRLEPARRPGHLGALEAMPSHLRVAAGASSLDALEGDGLVLEQPLGALVDPTTGRLVIQVARGLQLRDGRPTGHRFGDLELVGEPATLLERLDGMSSEARAIGIRDESAGLPRWRSVETPTLHGTALVRQRRRRA